MQDDAFSRLELLALQKNIAGQLVEVLPSLALIGKPGDHFFVNWELFLAEIPVKLNAPLLKTLRVAEFALFSEDCEQIGKRKKR